MQVDDAHISVRFKHGVHTIFLFVDGLAPFSKITGELLALLRERYPGGLRSSTTTLEKTLVPDAESAWRIVYGVLALPNDPSGGWKRLEVGERETYTPTRCGLEDQSIVAFKFVQNAGDGEGDDEDDERDVRFPVEWPPETDELYEQAAEPNT